MKLKKRIAKAEVGRANKILEKQLGNTKSTCAVIETVYAMGQTIEEREGLIKKKRK